MFQSWVGHVQTSLPDLAHIEVQKLEKPHDYLRYLVLVNTKGFRVPSWVASDGTLRLMALTLLAYTRNQDQIYLIEEPENGIHPQALETIFQSLSSVYDGQVLMATHSPLILGQADLDQILCFVKTADGEIDIIRGSQHPILKEWQHDISLGTLFAAGVLG